MTGLDRRKKKNGSHRWVSLSSSHNFLSSASAHRHYLAQIKCWHDAIRVDGAQRAQVPGEPSHPLSVPAYLRSCLSRYLFRGLPYSIDSTASAYYDLLFLHCPINHYTSHPSHNFDMENHDIMSGWDAILT
jgi:hypothetical protein